MNKSKESSSPSSLYSPSYSKLKSTYQNFLNESANLFPKVDQKLLLNMLQLETSYADWEGSVMLKVVYPAEKVNIESKKEWIYEKYQRVATIEEKEDPQIQRNTYVCFRTRVYVKGRSRNRIHYWFGYTDTLRRILCVTKLNYSNL